MYVLPTRLHTSSKDCKPFSNDRNLLFNDLMSFVQESLGSVFKDTTFWSFLLFCCRLSFLFSWIGSFMISCWLEKVLLMQLAFWIIAIAFHLPVSKFEWSLCPAIPRAHKIAIDINLSYNGIIFHLRSISIKTERSSHLGGTF